MKHGTSDPVLLLDRNEWIQAAIEVLAEQGVTGNAGRAPGEDLWRHQGQLLLAFQGPPDLFDAVLQTWRDGRIRTSTSRPSPLRAGAASNCCI
jgi:hypothetical protein